MSPVVILVFINLFVLVFNFLLLARVLMSWIMPGSTNWFSRLIFELTEPVLAPVRKLLPSSSGIDFSPLVTFFLLQALQILAARIFG